MAVDEHVLQQLAEQRIDGALVGALDHEVIGNRAVLPDGIARLGEQKPRGVAERRAAGLELFERTQSRFLAGGLTFSRRQAHEPCARGRRRAGKGAFLVAAPRGSAL